MKTRLTFVLIIVAILLTACGAKSAIKGKWQQANGGEIVEFADEGVLRVTTLGITVTGSYEFTDSDTIQMIIPTFLGDSTLLYDVDISGDTLTLTLVANNLSSSYTRVK